MSSWCVPQFGSPNRQAAPGTGRSSGRLRNRFVTTHCRYDHQQPGAGQSSEPRIDSQSHAGRAALWIARRLGGDDGQSRDDSRNGDRSRHWHAADARRQYCPSAYACFVAPVATPRQPSHGTFLRAHARPLPSRAAPSRSAGRGGRGPS